MTQAYRSEQRVSDAGRHQRALSHEVIDRADRLSLPWPPTNAHVLDALHDRARVTPEMTSAAELRRDFQAAG